jgi:hypothetical protein
VAESTGCNFGEIGKILKERLYNIERHNMVAKMSENS